MTVILRRLATVAALMSALTFGTVPNSQPQVGTTVKPAYVPTVKKRIKPTVVKRKPTLLTYTFIVTAYTANDSGMNGRAITYSGKPAIPYHTIAASSNWPIGTTFRTQSGQVWTVEDRGGAINASSRIDLYVGKHDVSTALQWGVKTVSLQLVKMGKGQ